MRSMPGIDLRHVSFSYGTRRALEDVSFAVPNGFCALLGPNGAGKSTLFSLLTGLFSTRQGSLAINGHDIARTPRAALASLGVVFQQSTLDPDLTVRRNLRYFAALHGLAGAEAARRIDAAMERLDIADRGQELVRNLNGGHRRRCEIARSLVHRPAVLLLDEPTVGLDAASRVAITRHVHDLAHDTSRDGGPTVLWATHLTDEVQPGDQVVILHQGRILADGPYDEVTKGRPLTDAFLEMTAASDMGPELAPELAPVPAPDPAHIP